MAEYPLPGGSPLVTLAIEPHPRDALLNLLGEAATLEQLDAWVDDWRACANLISNADMLEVGAYGAMRKIDIGLNRPLREFWK